MRIAQIAPLVESIPPKKYGGTERVVFALTEELLQRGHEVTLFASGDSQTSAKLVSVYPTALRTAKIQDSYGLNEITLLQIGLVYQFQEQFDIIHDHLSPLSIPTANIAFTPTIHTMHRPFTKQNKGLFKHLTNVHLVAISQAQAKMAPQPAHIAGVVYNGLPMEQYPFSERHNKYLLFVGRISMEKGVHLAIEVAKRVNLPLIVAAKLDEVELPYFTTHIRPFLSDPRMQWVGEVTEAERNELMKNALCLLHPVLWPEPFGLSMIEAMACGCPVIGFNKGSVPEVIQHGISGYVVQTVDQMVHAVKRIDHIKRKGCRAYALKKFSVKTMADGYEAVYKTILKNQLQIDMKRSVSSRQAVQKLLEN